MTTPAHPHQTPTRAHGLLPWFSRTGKLLPWLVLAASLTITYLLWLNERGHAMEELETDFHIQSHAINNLIEQRMQAYEQVLMGMRGLFAASGEVRRNEFSDYYNSLQIRSNFPGTQSMGYIQVVPAEQLGDHIAAVRSEGFPAYDVTPGGVRAVYAPVVYIEPFFARNLRAFGYDLNTDAVRRAAMETARDSNQPTLSGKLILAQDAGNNTEAGALLLLPVYKNGLPHDTLEERRANITGWVAIALRMNDLMAGILGDNELDLETEIRDGNITQSGLEDGKNTPNPINSILYDPNLHVTGQEIKPLFYSDNHLRIANHDWTVTTHTLPAFEERLDLKTSVLIAYAGIGLSVLLTLFTWQLVRSRTRALQLASTLAIESEKSKMLLHVASDGIYILDREGKIILTNDTLCRMLGYTAAEMRNMHVGQWNEKWTADKVTAKIAELLSQPGGVVFETRFRRRDGRFIEVEVNAVSVKIEGRTMLYSSVRDISQRRASEEAQRLAVTVFNTVDEAVMVICLSGKILTVNPSFSVITGYTPAEVIGNSPSMFSATAHAPDLFNQQIDFYEQLWQTMSTTGKWQGEVEHRRKSGEYYVAWLSITLVHDNQGQPTHYVGAFSDISVRKATEEHMAFLAHYDALTELPNRTLFGDRLQQALTQAKRDKGRLALIFIDLDSFKPVNDTYGHNVGDLLLMDAAKRMQECKRESDTVSRIGGDEFTLLLPSIETEVDAIVVAEKILQALTVPFMLEGHILQLSASIGIAIYPDHGNEDKLLLKHADMAMYHAKKNGRNNVMVYRPQMLESRQEHGDTAFMQ